MGLERVRLTKETAFGVFPTSPDGTVQKQVFLPMGNAMSVRPKPGHWTIKDAGFTNRTVRKNVGRIPIMGDLKSFLFPTQTAFVLDLVAGLTGSAPCLDLPSFTIDHLIDTDSCAAIYNRYLGCKIGDFTLACDQSDQGALVSISAAIIGSTKNTITSTDFATAALSAYPADDPYLFYQTAGKLIIGGVRTDYQSVSLSIKNVVKPFMGESRYASRVDWFGREVTLTAKLLFKSRTDRDDYEAGTKKAVSLAFDNGVTTTTLDLGGVVNIDEVGDDFPLDDYFTQTVSVTSLIDPTTGTDLSITVAADA